MKTHLMLVLVAAFVVTGCASTVMINSTPEGADAYVDGQYVGKTPVSYRDKAIIFTSHAIEIKKQGYAPARGSFARQSGVNAGALIGGLFVTVPWLWVLDYPSQVQYRLEPSATTGSDGGGGNAAQ